jgi:hypothetical protein
MARPRAKKIKAPFADEAAQFQAAMLGARMSIREVAARFGRMEAKIEEMMLGNVKPDVSMIAHMRIQADQIKKVANG